MCGRFTLTAPNYTALQDRFDFLMEPFDWDPRYNIAPGQQVPIVVIRDEQRHLVPMTWGLVPHWSKDRKIGYRMINARAETIKEKPSFRESFKRKRCLIPADGFYEWNNKRPVRICLKDEGLFAFAGLFDCWEDPKGGVLQTFTIITTEANKLLRAVHDRMPVILPRERESDWLDPKVIDPSALLQAYPADLMQYYEVSPLVNAWQNDRSECIVRVKS